MQINLIYFCGGGIVTQLICRSDRIIMTNILQKYVVNWYHIYLLHTVTECTEATITQHYYWINIRNNICTQNNGCKTFQNKKKQNLKYGQLTAK